MRLALVFLFSLGLSSCREERSIETSFHSERFSGARDVASVHGREFDDATYNALGKATPFLEMVLSSEDSPPLMRILKPAPEMEEVDWATVKELIFAGRIVEGVAAHSKTVDVYTIDGRHLRTTAPEVDSFVEACAEVDPRGVFIRAGME